MNTSFTGQNSAQKIKLCQGDDTALQLKTNIIAAHQNPEYQWQLNANDGAGWQNIAGATSTSLSLNFKSALPGLYQYRLYSIQQENRDLDCCQVFSDTTSVQINAKPVPAVSGNTPLCAGETLYLHVADGASYQWTGPAGFTSTAQNPIIDKVNSAQSGWYRVTLTSASGCAATDSVRVDLHPATSFSAGAAVTICAGSSTVLNASGGIRYQWFPALGLSDATIANPVASPAASTVYQVKITNQYGCVYTDSVSVAVSRPPLADAGPDKKTVAGKSVRLSGKITGNNYTYYWLPNTYLTNGNTLEPLVTPTENITYTLHAVSALGCGETVDSVKVEISPELTVPNTFSPNADGINDTWKITALDAYPASLIEVYNRYGKEIYRTTGSNNSWDGTYNGQPLPVGTYYFKISSDGKMLKSGWVLIVR
ncbi:MAG: gliding motility-associated C-terminal domain-containing protein [Sphingobacteriaceae bacterium]|nr:MAG: gliding motility-associated C-terminal domain-containing protein [Sphingobacteriaceae bacterium]